MRGGHLVGTLMATAAVLVTGLVAGCSAPGDRSVPDAAMNAFRSLLFQPAGLGHAEALATQRCLREAGFDPPLSIALTGSVANLPRSLDEATALTDGYGEALRTSPGDTGNPLDRYAQSLPAARRQDFHLALNDESATQARLTTPSGWEFSASRGGCVAAGRAAVYDSVDNWLIAYYLPQDLNLLAADVGTAPPVSETAQGYQACMAHEGYSVETPQQAVEHARAIVGTGSTSATPPAAEIRLAATDARCQARSLVVSVWLDEFERQAEGWIADNQARVLEASAIVHNAIIRADEIRAG